MCLVGTSSNKDGTFVWSWGNEAIPVQHAQALEVVYDFGREHQLALLTTPCIQGGRPEATECLGTYVDQQGDVSLYFSILHLQVAVPNDQLPS